MKRYNYSELSEQDIQILVRRNFDPNDNILNIVNDIISHVKQDGDTALINYALKFDGVILNKLYIDKAELELLASEVTPDQKFAIEVAYNNIYKFHEAQLKKEDKIETTKGVTCWREFRAIEKVGLYIPGGSAVLPSTFLMLGIPAKIAGCSEIIVCSPPQKNGKVNRFIAFVALKLGIEKVYTVGGAQAIAALANGTKTINKVDKIFGPGNQFVTKAKTIIQSTTNTAIDMPAGPSEVLIIADETSNPKFVAADLLAQAEHGSDSQAILVCTSNLIIDNVLIELEKQILDLPRVEIAKKAISNSYIITVNNLMEAINFSNEYAPEHLILATENWQNIIDFIINAGSVFLGNLTPESAGDYASGTNHTLPTSSFAKAYSGVSVDSFVKKITFQHISAEGLGNLGPIVEVLAELEGLHAHKNAISIRLK